jgi:putative transposase
VKFGLTIAMRVRSTTLERGDKWHLDELVVTINGRKHWLWRAVDQHGAVLDVLVHSRGDAAAAKRLMRKLLKRHGRPRVIVTDKLRSYAAANNELGPERRASTAQGAEQPGGKFAPADPGAREGDAALQIGAPASTIRFASVHGQVANLFMGCRYNQNARHKREARAQAIAAWEWERASCARMAA